MQIAVQNGRGYVAASDNKSEDMPIGVIPVDSLFSPIKKVNYQVESTRVGKRDDFDKLTLEIWTDGSIKPNDALSFAAKILVAHFKVFETADANTKFNDVMVEKLTLEIWTDGSIKPNDALSFADGSIKPNDALSFAAKILVAHFKVFETADANTKFNDVMVEKEDDTAEKKLEMTIEELDLSVRSYNCLKRAGINTLQELTDKTEADMMRVRNLGRKSLDLFVHTTA